MPLVKRKPAKSEGEPARPRLMAELGIDHWANVPTSILDALMTLHISEEVRIIACVLRHSFGCNRPYAVSLIESSRPGEPARVGPPMRVVDIAKATGIATKNAHDKVLAMISIGWIKKDNDGRYCSTFRLFRINYLTRKIPPFGGCFRFNDPNVKERFFREWEEVETEEQKAYRELEEQYQQRRERVKEKYQVEYERKRLDDIPKNDPRIEVRK